MEVADLVSARRQDYVNGHASEAVYRASLKALGLKREEIELEVEQAAKQWVERAKYADPEAARMKQSVDWLKGYLEKKA